MNTTGLTVFCLALPTTLYAAPVVIAPNILDQHTHDNGAFTQGLLLYNGFLYESTGLFGSSSLREVNPTTGAVIRQHDLSNIYFAEGLARVGNRLIQLTWQSGIAFEYDLATFAETNQFTYTGDGWGLCYDGQRLVMSNGSNILTFRNPTTFAVIGTLPVTRDSQAIDDLNELECVGQSIWANIWGYDDPFPHLIVEIDATTGELLSEVEVPDLVGLANSDAVLNGIAHVSGDTFLFTGKLWPTLFEARFTVPSGNDGPPGGDPVDPGGGDSDSNKSANGSTEGGCKEVAPTPLACALALVALLRRRRHA